MDKVALIGEFTGGTNSLRIKTTSLGPREGALSASLSPLALLCIASPYLALLFFALIGRRFTSQFELSAF